MKIKSPVIFLSASCFFAAPLFSQPLKSLKETPLKKEIRPKEEITKSIIHSTETLKEGVLGSIIRRMVIPLEKGPIIPLPIMDSSKDLGINYGIMPIWAIRNRKKKVISAVIAPSLNYNHYLGTTLTYRHYLFPDEKTLFVLRALKSTEIQKEFFVHYYTPDFLSSGARLNWETRYWVNGKASFYGFGPDSKKEDKANYALHLMGEEFTLETPLYKNLYIHFMHMWYNQKVSKGPIETDITLKDYFPNSYDSVLTGYKSFHTNRISILYDDTDHPFLPRIGTNARISMLYSLKTLGSSYNYRTFSAEIKHYYNYKNESNFITAARYLFEYQSGDELPFYAQCRLGESAGLRMAGDGRFTGRGKIVVNIEERITISKKPILNFFSEIEISPFLDMGTVFGKTSEIDFSDMKYGPGVAFRIVIRPQVVGTADFAFGSEGTNTIIKVDYPF